MKVVVENLKIGGIGALNVYEENISKSAPIILMLHGFNHYKEFHLKDAYYFARRGYFVTLFDSYRHGENADPKLGKLRDFEKIMEFPDISLATARRISMIADYHKQANLADFQKIGLIGFSFGGSVIFDHLAMGVHPYIRAIVPVIALPPMMEILEFFIKNIPEASVYFDNQKIGYLESNSLGSKLMQVKDFPVLMLNGTNDTFSPIDFIRKFYLEMKSNYTASEKINLIEYPGLGHESTPEMMDEAAKWFDQYLK